jgi:uncharacterized protein
MFSWVDLATTDPEAAKSFYSALFGWEPADRPGAAGTYTVFRRDGSDVAGCFAQPDGDGAPPHWNSYVTVVDAAAVSARAAELGGAVTMPAANVEGIGRMAVISDPAGAMLALWEPHGHVGAGLVNAPGALCWNDLGTTDVDRAMEFHGALFGWTFHERLDDDPLRYMRIHNGETENGSIHQQGEDERGSPPHWDAYFATSDLDATSSRVGELGGEVVVPPLEVPAGRVSVVLDPQGAAFGLFDGPLDP